MKRIVSLTSLIVIVLAVIIFAADSTVTVDSIVKNVEKVVDLVKDVKESGSGPQAWLLAAAIVNLLMSLMKFKYLAKYLNTPEIKKFKPYIALVLGIIAGSLNDIIGGADVVESLIAGVMSGLGAIGIHECSHAAVLKSLFIKVNNAARKVSDAKTNG